jgi:hypothetical protein
LTNLTDPLPIVFQSALGTDPSLLENALPNVGCRRGTVQIRYDRFNRSGPPESMKNAAPFRDTDGSWFPTARILDGDRRVIRIGVVDVRSAVGNRVDEADESQILSRNTEGGT